MNSFIALGILLLLMYLTFVLAIVQLKKDNSIGNFTWGGGCILLALYTFFALSSHYPRQILVTTLIVLWGIRLIAYLYSRYKKGADPRFIEWQKQWGKYALLMSLRWIFIMEGALLLVMSLPGVFVNVYSPPGLTWLDWAGLAVWCVGFFFESVSDYQLYTFMRNPENKGKIMDRGLWHYSRHPNYFGEITMWWGIYLILLSVPGGWLTIVTPMTITILLIFFTGVPWVEKVFAENPAYQEYKKHTSMLIPWPPKAE